MIYSNYPFTLDIHGVVSQISFPVSLNDTARSLLISLTDGGKPYEITDGCRAVFAALKPDGTCLFNDCIIVGNKVIRYDFTPQTASVKGKVDCEVRLYGVDGNLVTSPRFTIVVYEGLLDERILSEDEKTTVDNMVLAEQARIAAENERIASDAEREEIARRAEAAAERVEESVNGDDVFIRYSAYPDGRGYTDTWQRGLNYIGVAAGLKEPEDASGYQWSLFAPNIYVGSGEMPDYADVQIDPEIYDTISEGATALGKNTVAGSRGFRIIASSGTSGGMGTYTLEGYTGGYVAEDAENGVEGDVYTVCTTVGYYDRRGKITAINGNVITVDNFVADTIVTNPEGDQNTFRVDAKPEIGDIDTGAGAVALGVNTKATGREAFAMGHSTQAHGRHAVALGKETHAAYDALATGAFSKASGMHSFAGGHYGTASGRAAFAHGDGTTASGGNAVAFGDHTNASGYAAFTQGSHTKATGSSAAAFGYGSEKADYQGASGWASFVAGSNTQATGECSAAFGDGTKATVRRAMAIGASTKAAGDASLAGGWASRTGWELALAFGSQAVAEAKASQAFGIGTYVNRPSVPYENMGKMAIGRYNTIEYTGDIAFVIGNGTSDTARSDAFYVKWDGTICVGGVTITPAQLTKLLALIA